MWGKGGFCYLEERLKFRTLEKEGGRVLEGVVWVGWGRKGNYRRIPGFVAAT